MKGAEIYLLICPRSGEPRYVGKANNSAKRLSTHLRDARRRNTPLYSWIKSLTTEGLKPSIRCIAVAICENWQDLEAQVIQQYKSDGARLLNMALGGDEPYCSKETRAANGKKVSRDRDHKRWSLLRRIGIEARRLQDIGSLEKADNMRMMSVLIPMIDKEKIDHLYERFCS